MLRRLREPALAGLAALCAAVVAVPVGPPVVRAIAGVALIVVLPGAALVGAGLGAREAWPERLVMALGLGVAAVAFAALALYLAHVPLRVTAWAATLAGVTAAGCAVGAVLRRRRPAAPRLRLPRVRARDVVLLACALALGGGALALGAKPLRAPRGSHGYTSVWVDGGGARRAGVVVSSGELHRTTYQLLLTVDGHLAAVPAEFTLAPREVRRFPLPGSVARGARVEAVLYRLGGTIEAPYRRVESRIGQP